MKIRYEAISDVGCTRSNNEDMALVFGAFIRDDSQSSMVPMKSRPRFTAIVADGMGGYGGGEIASEMTLRSFNAFLASMPAGADRREVAQAVRDWFKANSEAVIARASTDPELNQMGCTLTGIFTYGNDDFMVNAGDSRVYRWRYETLRQLTADHSERERTGDPTVPSNLIYNAVGVPGAFVDVTCLSSDMPMIDGDKYIICSDGLCDMVSDDDIAAILARGGGARDLVDAALAAGGLDNCTVIELNVSIPEEEEMQAQAEPVQEDASAGAEVAVEEKQPLQEEGFVIDGEAEENTEISAGADDNDTPEVPHPESDEPAPPPFKGMPESASASDDEISYDDALRLAPGEPTAAERARMARSRLREAWDILRGKKQ